MATIDVDAARDELTADRARLSGQLERLTGAANVASSSPDVLDGGSVVTERDQTNALVASKRSKLAAVDAALAAIEDGTYGTCASCGTPIDPDRLEVLPATVTCASCTR